MTFDLFSYIDSQTITGGLFGAGLVWFGEIVRAKYNKSKNAHYLAVRFIPILEQFLDSCYAVAFDDGTDRGLPADDGIYYKPQTKEPSLDLPNDVDWKSIDKKLLESIMQLSSDLYSINKTLEGEWEFADPPYGEFMSIRRYQYAKFSIKCDKLFKDVIATISMTPKEKRRGKCNELGKNMNKEQIESLAKLGESEILEFKRSTGERKEATKTICAMLNNRGGRVLFGIEPNGKVIGQDVSDHTVEEVAQELKNIEPPVFPNVDRVFVDGRREVLIITVTTGANQPYSYKGDAYKRVGNTSQTMSRDEYNRVLIERLHSERRWENEASTDWAIDDLDGNEIVKTLEEAIRRGRAEDPRTRDPLEILRGFGLVRDGKILRAAVVLFGNSKKIETTYPQLLLRVAKFKGMDKTEFLDNRQFHGNVLDLLSKAEKFFRENLPISSVVEEGKMARTDTPLYPPIALREALANAFCHRDYSIGGGSVSIAIYEDRVEISSSGSLHFGLTSEALFQPHESMPWNPLIARVFYRSGIIESWGRGTLKMLEETRDAGLIEPTIVDAGGSVTVCFKSTPLQVTKLTDRQKDILKILKTAKNGLALREIHEKLPEASDRQIREDLATLQTLGLAYSYGHGRGAGWKSHL